MQSKPSQSWTIDPVRAQEIIEKARARQRMLMELATFEIEQREAESGHAF